MVCFVSGRQPERFVLSSMVEIYVFEERFRNDIQKIVPISLSSGMTKCA